MVPVNGGPRRVRSGAVFLASVAWTMAALLAACQREVEAPPQEIRPVRTVTIEKRDAATPVTLTGTIRARDEAPLAFRLSGRMIDRLVANGWVECRTQADDRRVKRVYLTREAERVHKRIWRVAEDTVNAALADLTSLESRQLMNLLQRIKKTLVSADNGEASASSAPMRKRPHAANGRHNGKAPP